ncbi:STAS domain-containing protein [Kutzneria kofuensis]|uniref:Anti-sigma factor antagonist n=1 Tax=Kutzneria kofuensis TaxID=103725 RepID=A0A7W9KEZ6_9PSEU|nr:STAS domain-containing protein [Kutzneria kofuensis]MBB5890943.1 anti-anti-sigma factor [Kutzneria kofuensis]
MSFNTKVHIDDGVVTIRLTGELDSRSAPTLNEVIVEATEKPVRRLVLLAEDLTYLSSAGLRCLVFAHQKLGRGVDIVLVGATPEVAETIRLTGFDRSLVMQDLAER